ncbi:ribose-phosphate pyrophosphokinase [Colidextribacter sp. OB.20]|uniref:ribose-phosphate diphosphokinase n=1 Tax=Colidextribacter sp. OB.20 TaxID=2304568 RepID=UPI00137141BA|nr:ribose-phosphate pyrophosphokinase [Colidextribacter sp. OB.20]NBI08763.1 ribose-phosphate pyrophosphokinase [Colidextribacter sp. OB.20]
MIAHGKDIKVITGNSNPALAADICKELGIPLGNSVVGAFSDGENFASIYETVRGSDVFVVQSTCSFVRDNKDGTTTNCTVNDALMELLIIIDGLKRASAGRITAVIPYFGYARQDRKTKPRDPISAKLVANLITTAGADRVLTMDLHANQIQGFFDIPVDNMLGSPIFVDYFNRKFKDSREDTMVVSPDVGSVARARAFAQKLDMPLAIVDKRRQKANSSEVMNIIGDVRDKRVILLDDMVDTGGSLCHAAKALVEIGGARDVTACASHGVLSGPAIQRIQDSALDEVVFLNTIPPKEDVSCGKIRYISVAHLFAEAISHIYMETSVSPLFV